MARAGPSAYGLAEGGLLKHSSVLLNAVRISQKEILIERISHY